MGKIPSQLRSDVIAELYRRFDEMQWEERTQSERSFVYQHLVEDPSIGGRLAPHLPFDRIRVWIKDGPAKEYQRALEGVGPYASFTGRRAMGGEGVVEAVLGEGWTVVAGSVEEKPMRCLARRGDPSRLVVWGPGHSLKELFWHVAVHLADQRPNQPPLIVVTKRGNAPIDAALWCRAKRLGDLIGCEVAQASSAVTVKIDKE